MYQEGLLLRALRTGQWVVLDELNLAPTDVLEALNRLLDDNHELFVPEINAVVTPHPRFMLFATQNPPGMLVLVCVVCVGVCVVSCSFLCYRAYCYNIIMVLFTVSSFPFCCPNSTPLSCPPKNTPLLSPPKHPSLFPHKVCMLDASS